VTHAVEALAGILIVTVGGGEAVWIAASPGDRLAAEVVVVGAGTFLVALWAAAIAAVAYAQSDRRPVLRAQVRLLFDVPTDDLVGERAPQVAVHSLGPSGVPGWPDGSRLPNAVLQCQVTNHGEVTARNVTLTVDIWAVQINGIHQIGVGWRVVDRDYALGRTRFLWDGGPDQAVHPGQTRPLPDIGVDSCIAVVGTRMRIKAALFADQTTPFETESELSVEGPLHG
jgi:hypothetical protein